MNFAPDRTSAIGPIRASRKGLFALFIASGMVSLVYQVLWFRMLALVFGNTVIASSIVLASFFAGLAVGSILFGKLADRIRKRILIYGVLEAGIGIYALLFRMILPWVASVDEFFFAQLGETLPLHMVRMVLSGLLLMPPTILMGGTFPLLAKHVAKDWSFFRHGVSVLYFLNTAGAVLGTLLAGYLLIAKFGIRATTWLAAIFNILIFLFSAMLQARSDAVDRTESRLGQQVFAKTEPDSGSRFALIATLLSGFASLVYEVAWMRAFTTYFGSSVYAFAAIVAVFLIGIALGSLYFSAGYRRYRPLHAFGEIQLRIALSVVLFLMLFIKLPVFILWGLRTLEPSFATYQVLQFAILAIAMLYTTINLGASFPAIIAAYIRSLHSAGHDVGRIYAFNTVGAIAGSLLAGLLLIPLFGVQKSIHFALLINLILGVLTLLRVKAMDRLAWIWTISCIGLFVLLPSWDKNVLNSGIYSTAYSFTGKSTPPPEIGLDTPGLKIYQNWSRTHSPEKDITTKTYSKNGKPRILFFKEGTTSTISVIEDSGGFRSLLINGKADASTNPADMRTQLLLGHLPMILARKMPSSALVIGLGSGTTLGSIGLYPIPRIDSVEIEPAVVEAARRFFSEVNKNSLSDPRIHLTITDARTFMQRTKHKYDLITSEPSNLWMAGCSNLFTREFFVTVRDRLTTDGIMCQWIHLYQISVNDVRTFLRTYSDVFPHVSVWIDKGDMLVLGSQRPIDILPDLIRARLSVIQPELQPSGLGTLSTLLPLYSADTEMVKRFASGAPVNTDDHPILEFSAPKSILEINSYEVARQLLEGIPYQR